MAGQVSICFERCDGCGNCVEICPFAVLAMSEVLNTKGRRVPHVLHPERCNGCNFCGMSCSESSILGSIPSQVFHRAHNHSNFGSPVSRC